MLSINSNYIFHSISHRIGPITSSSYIPMFDQEQLAAIAAAMSILQQQQQQQAIINQYQAGLHKTDHHNPEQQQLNRIRQQIDVDISPLPEIQTQQPPISDLSPSATSIHTSTMPVTAVPHHMQLPHLQPNHHQQQQKPSHFSPNTVEQQQSQPLMRQISPVTNKVNMASTGSKQIRPPISYSAIVAKSAGLAANNGFNIHTNTNSASGTHKDRVKMNNAINIDSIVNGNAPVPITGASMHNEAMIDTNNSNMMSNIRANHTNRVPSGFASISSNNYVLDDTSHRISVNGLNPTNSLASSIGATLTTNTPPTIDSDLLTKFSNLRTDNGTSSLKSTYDNPSSFIGLQRATINNQFHSNASNNMVNEHKDIFASDSNQFTNHLTNNLTGSSLGQTNGSSLLNPRSTNIITTSKNLHQQRSLTLEPTLNFSTDHSTSSPAHQLFSSNLVPQQHNHHQHQHQTSSNISQHLMPTDIFNHQNHQQPSFEQHQHINNINSIKLNTLNSPPMNGKTIPIHGKATNLLGFMGLYVGNLSPDLTKEQLEKIFSRYGEPVKAHRLIRSPVAFIKYENTESPRAAIDDLYGLLLPELTLNQDQPLKLHFDRNDTQLRENYRPTDLPKEDNGECYGWRTTVCRKGKSCPKKHIQINRGIDFQMWMIKSNPASTSALNATNSFATGRLHE